MSSLQKSNAGVTIQRLTVAEGERLRAVRLRALCDAPDAYGATYDESAARPLSNWMEQLAALATFVAVLDEVDVGLVRGGPYEGKPGAAMLYSMWVAPGARGTGIGESLVDAVADWGRSQRHTRLYLNVCDHNAHAVALYARKGF